jgi:glutathionylspermidine synthase
VRREASVPREGWRERVESVGLPHHTSADGATYWDESRAYVLSMDEVDALEEATQELHGLCLQAAQHVIQRGRWDELRIPRAVVPLIEASWAAAEPTLYGRFDLAYDGRGAPRMLEYNADTPTSLVEAAVAQWYWLQDVAPNADQFNSIHERLVAGWRALMLGPGGQASRGAPPTVHVAAIEDPEDQATVAYLRDTAEQAGLVTRPLLMQEIGWDHDRSRFVDLDERPIDAAFKLYPWEWMAHEGFAPQLIAAASRTRWIEPPWKMILSNKGILAILWELFPNHPNLLPAYFDDALLEAYARKPLLSREGANVSLVLFGETVAETRGDYGEEGYVYQALAPLPTFEGASAVIGSWVVAGEAAGIGIRESDGPITGNTSRFVPHLIG